MRFNFYRAFLKAWITVASLGAFLVGWVVFGHSGKPVSGAATTQQDGTGTSELAPLPTLAPLPSFNDPGQSIQPLPQVQQPLFQSRPRLRTMGS